MSYKFNLDHTLSVVDIHDMITIDIKPETRCVVVDGDVLINGYLAFRGSYLTPELTQAPFEGYIPVDITLPYHGGAPDVVPEVVSFDYRVANQESLTLNLEIALAGYTAAPIPDQPVYEEAVIEPFDFVMTEADDDVRVEQIPYSPLVELTDEVTTVAPVTITEPPVTTDLVEGAVDLNADATPEFETEPVRTELRLTESASALMDELFALKRGTDLKEQLGIVDPTVTTEKAGKVEGEIEVAVEKEPQVSPINDSWWGQFGDSFTTIRMINSNDTAVE